jgi:hypothetical protein
MKHRWYDKDPTLSMAVSLLHNASKTHQEMAARYLFQVMEHQGIMQSAELRTQTDRVRFIFPSFRRNGFEMHARHLVELLKHLSYEHQQMLAVQLINYIYILDGGLSEIPLPEEHDTSLLLQPESG